jgi:hypothetical protein
VAGKEERIAVQKTDKLFRGEKFVRSESGRVTVVQIEKTEAAENLYWTLGRAEMGENLTLPDERPSPSFFEQAVKLA